MTTDTAITDQLDTLFHRNPLIRGMVEQREMFGPMLGAALDEAEIMYPDLLDGIEAVRENHLVYTRNAGWMHSDEAVLCASCGIHDPDDLNNNLCCHACASEGDGWPDMQATERRIYERSVL